MILKRRALLVAGAAVKRRRTSRAVDARAADTRGGARLVVDCMLKANDIVAGLHSRPPERVGARTAATPSTGQRAIMIKVYAFSTPNSVR